MDYAEKTIRIKKHLQFILATFPHNYKVIEFPMHNTWEIIIDLEDPVTQTVLTVENLSDNSNAVKLRFKEFHLNLTPLQTSKLGTFLVIVAGIEDVLTVIFKQ